MTDIKVGDKIRVKKGCYTGFSKGSEYNLPRTVGTVVRGGSCEGFLIIDFDGQLHRSVPVNPDSFELVDKCTCARCGEPRREHSYDGACYGLCGEFIAMDTKENKFNPGDKVRTFQSWSHVRVGTTGVVGPRGIIESCGSVYLDIIWDKTQHDGTKCTYLNGGYHLNTFELIEPTLSLEIGKTYTDSKDRKYRIIADIVVPGGAEVFKTDGVKLFLGQREDGCLYYYDKTGRSWGPNGRGPASSSGCQINLIKEYVTPPPKKTGVRYMNVFESFNDTYYSILPTPEKAKESRKRSVYKALACVKVEWAEGQFDD